MYAGKTGGNVYVSVILNLYVCLSLCLYVSSINQEIVDQFS